MNIPPHWAYLLQWANFGLASDELDPLISTSLPK
jgi:hypothetical protein